MTLPAHTIEHAVAALNLRTEFPAACLAEAQALVDAVTTGQDSPAQTSTTHRDLRTLPFVTIDNEDSRDLDQALLVEALDTGYRVRYALADASCYVPEHSALYAEALQRGATYYTPTHSIPMLPQSLSEGLISLNPGVDRRALVFDLYLNHTGETSRCDVLRAWIHSQAKLSYAGVQHRLDRSLDNGQDASTSDMAVNVRSVTEPSDELSDKPWDEPWAESIRLLKVVGELLIAQQLSRGAIEFTRREARVEVSGSPPRFGVQLRERLDTERYNEQISLLCNMQGAKLLQGLSHHDPGLDAIYRAHDAPGERSLKALRRTLDQLVAENGVADSWRWARDETLAEYVARMPTGASDARMVQAVQRQILLLQRASEFQSEAAPHHALKANSYARFSSPMREVVGIHTHAELLQALEQDERSQRAASQTAGQHSPASGTDGARTEPATLSAEQRRRDAVIVAANLSRQTQKRLDKLIGLAVLRAHFESPDAHRHLGTIVGLRDGKLYISLDSLALDVKVYADDLDAQFHTSYEVTDVAAVPLGDTMPRWALGQAVELLPAGFDPSRNRIRFTLNAA